MRTGLNPALYQINTRICLNELSRELGRPAVLNDLSDAYLDELADLGFDWIWLLGVWETGPAGRSVSRSNREWLNGFRSVLPDLSENDITGSPFAVRAYRVHEDFGGDAALAKLRSRLAKRGLRLMLDYVPNHTALDHAWATTHPEYYVRGSEQDLSREPHNYARVQTRAGERILAHGRDPYFPGWPDTFQLDYRSAECRAAMAQQLCAIAELCDGVRCDMAMLLLPDVFQRTWGPSGSNGNGSHPLPNFWPDAIQRVRARHPRFVFMAEVYWDREWELQQLGFDYTYDKRLYDRLTARNAEAIYAHLQASPEFQHKSVRFLENHDEPRAASHFAEGVHQAAAALTFFVPGLRFFYEGQLEGRRVHASIHLGRRPAEPVDDALHSFYRRLLETLKLPVLRAGHWELLATQIAWVGNPTAHNVLAFSWEDYSQRLIVAVNYAPTQAQCYLRMPWCNLRGRSFQLRDRLSGTEYVRGGDDLEKHGLYLDVAPWQVHVFDVEPESARTQLHADSRSPW